MGTAVFLPRIPGICRQLRRLDMDYHQSGCPEPSMQPKPGTNVADIVRAVHARRYRGLDARWDDYDSDAFGDSLGCSDHFARQERLRSLADERNPT